MFVNMCTCCVVCCFCVLEMRVASPVAAMAFPSLESWLEFGEFPSTYPFV
jgi:hypothetical protein